MSVSFNICEVNILNVIELLFLYSYTHTILSRYYHELQKQNKKKNGKENQHQMFMDGMDKYIAGMTDIHCVQKCICLSIAPNCQYIKPWKCFEGVTELAFYFLFSLYLNAKHYRFIFYYLLVFYWSTLVRFYSWKRKTNNTSRLARLKLNRIYLPFDRQDLYCLYNTKGKFLNLLCC